MGSDLEGEVSAHYRLESIPGHVVLTVFAMSEDDVPESERAGVKFTMPLPVQDAIRFNYLFANALDDATQEWDWSEGVEDE